MTFKHFTGYEYLLIDIANQAGQDKLLFEERIEWVKQHMDNLEMWADSEDACKPLYLKAVMALRKAQAGRPTGHRVGLDASNSGMQIMSVLTGCVKGADATGLIDPTKRADAYSLCTETMRGYLGNAFDISRKQAKAALMTLD